MTIISILLVAILPAFLKMVKGQVIETGIREIGTKLKSTRTYAITQRQYTALVLFREKPQRIIGTITGLIDHV